jgi:hypothetical protein
VPADADIELRFDRYLLPSTPVRQSVLVYSRLPELHFFLEPHYDVVERVVRFSLPGDGTWPRGVRYGVQVLVPSEPSDPGFRAFDGAPLTANGSVPLEFSFRVQSGDPIPAEPPPPAAGCADAFGVFERGGCQNRGCHQPEGTPECQVGYAALSPGGACVQVPRMGLDLSSPAGVQATAVNQVAHQTETGPNSGVVMENPDRFGVQMPLIDPSRPGNSYLLYKLLRHPRVWERSPCETRYRVDPAGQCPEPSASERDRLREWFVTGQPMPMGGGDLTRADLDVLQAWILYGAPMTDCE